MSPGTGAYRVVDQERGEHMHSTPVRWMAARLHLMRSDRGDVPGWVMVTLMTAIVVAALTPFVSDELRALLARAFAMVSG